MLCVTCLFFAIKPTNFTEIFVESSFMRGSSSVHKLLELSLNLNATHIDDLIILLLLLLLLLLARSLNNAVDQGLQ